MAALGSQSTSWLRNRRRSLDPKHPRPLTCLMRQRPQSMSHIDQKEKKEHQALGFCTPHWSIAVGCFLGRDGGDRGLRSAGHPGRGRHRRGADAAAGRPGPPQVEVADPGGGDGLPVPLSRCSDLHAFSRENRNNKRRKA